MANVGDKCNRVGNISRQEAEEAIKRINATLSNIYSPGPGNAALSFLAVMFPNPIVAMIGFANVVYTLGASVVTKDLNDQKSFYTSIRDMYIRKSNLLGVEVAQTYIYRLCQESYGWYLYGKPVIKRLQYPGGWVGPNN